MELEEIRLKHWQKVSLGEKCVEGSLRIGTDCKCTCVLSERPPKSMHC